MKKNRFFILIIYLVFFIVFLYFESKLYRKYVSENNMRNHIKSEKTEEIKDSFLLRKKYFYLDKEYSKNYKTLMEKSSKEGKE